MYVCDEKFCFVMKRLNLKYCYGSYGGNKGYVGE